MEEKRFLVINEMKDGCGDCDVHDFEQLEAANRYASMIWDHLTERERKNRIIKVWLVTLEDLADWAIDEDGVIDWSAYEQLRNADGGFDSGKAGA